MLEKTPLGVPPTFFRLDHWNNEDGLPNLLPSGTGGDWPFSRKILLAQAETLSSKDLERNLQLLFKVVKPLRVLWWTPVLTFIFLNKEVCIILFYVFIFREREREGEREGEKHWSVACCFLHAPHRGPARNQACALTGNSTGDLLVHRPSTQSTEPHPPGHQSPHLQWASSRRHSPANIYYCHECINICFSNYKYCNKSHPKSVLLFLRYTQATLISHRSKGLQSESQPHIPWGRPAITGDASEVCEQAVLVRAQASHPLKRSGRSMYLEKSLPPRLWAANLGNPRS